MSFNNKLYENAVPVCVCDACGHEFFLKAVQIKERVLQIEDKLVKVQYFVCKKCGRVYPIALKDARYFELLEDFLKQKRRYEKLYGKNGDEQVLRGMYSSVLAKQERLKRHEEQLRRSCSGVFTLNEKGKLIYLP